MTNVRQVVLDRLDAIAPDCGDNSCRFAIKKGGMRTNGGCRCLAERYMVNWSPVERLAVAQGNVIRELLDEVDRLNDEWEK